MICYCSHPEYQAASLNLFIYFCENHPKIFQLEKDRPSVIILSVLRKIMMKEDHSKYRLFYMLSLPFQIKLFVSLHFPVTGTISQTVNQ